MDDTPNQTSGAEQESSIGITSNVGNARIEQLCEAVLGLSPELKSVWYEFKSGANQQQE